MTSQTLSTRPAGHPDSPDELPLGIMNRIVRLAARGFNVPYVLITFYTGKRHVVAAYHGPQWLERMPDVLFSISRTAREPGLVIHDVRQDPWCAHSPAVTGEPGIRFYAGVPIMRDQVRVGVMCLMDQKLHDDFGERDLLWLREQAGMIEEALALQDGFLMLETLKQPEPQPVSWLLPFFNLPLVDLDDKTPLELRVMQIFQLLMDTSPQAIFWKDRGGTYIWCNRKFATDAGLDSPRDVVGKTDRDLSYSSKQAERLRELDEQILKSGQPVLHQVEALSLANGKLARVSFNTTPVHDVEGSIVGILGTYEDITERVEAEEALRDSKQVLQLVFDNIPQAVFWKDGNSIIRGGNKAFAIDAGLKSAEELAGLTDYDLPWSRAEAEAFIRDDRRVMENDTPTYHIQEHMTQADGKLAWLDTNKVPLHDAEGRVVGVLGTYEDITERKRAEEELRRAHEELENRVKERTNELTNANLKLRQEILERQRAESELLVSRERYAMAVNAGQVGIWEWNAASRELYLDPSLKTLLGIQEQESGRPLDAWMNKVHPEDRSEVQRAMQAYLLHGAADYEQEYRVMHPVAGVRWVLARGSTLLNENGVASRKTGSLTNITALKNVEEALRRRDEILDALTYASQQLLSLESLDSVLPTVLAQMARSVQFSRAYILKNSGDEGNDLRAVEYSIWNEDGSRDRPPLEVDYARLGVETWAKVLKAGMPLCGQRDDFAAREKGLFDFLQIESIAWVPIFCDRVWWGVLGFDHRESDRRCIPAEVEALKTAASTLGAAFSQQQIRDAEREQRSLAEALSEIAGLLNSTLNLDGVLDHILNEIGRVVPHDTAVIILTDKNKARQTRFYGDRLRVQPELDEQFLQSDGVPTLATMRTTRQPLIIPNTDTSNLWIHRPHLEWVRSYLGAPIMLEGEVIGYINLNSARPGFFAPVHAERLQAFADQAAIAIQNASLYEQAQALAALEERQRLARDLHDAVSQTLWTASITAERLPEIWENDREEGYRSLTRLTRLTHGALAEMRTLLLELRPGALLKVPLEDLLEQLAQATMARKKLNISVETHGSGGLPPDVQVGIYRIAQEALNNVAKHSRATDVKLILEHQTGELTMTILDNGQGFDLEHIPAERLGLQIMRERANAIRAGLSIRSTVGGGTKIMVHWPRQAEISESKEEVYEQPE